MKKAVHENLVQEKQKEYLIGDVAKMVGLSRDALRFYEKKGVISARKKENGYRYYSEDDIYKLMSILYHRKMNTSLEKIEDLMSGGRTIHSIREHIHQRMEEEKEALRLHNQAMARLKLMERDIEHINRSLNQCSLRTFPLAYVMGKCENLQAGLRQWFILSATLAGLDMTYFYNVFSIRDGGLVNGGTILLFYKELEHELGKEFQPENYPMTEETECIYMVIESKETLPEYSMAQKMVQWGRDHGMEAEGIMYSNNMTSFYNKNETTYYLELYMPVKRKLTWTKTDLPV